jgi:FtsP/CotA-like multicopper oxidase with cupredoxin domain
MDAAAATTARHSPFRLRIIACVAVALFMPAARALAAPAAESGWQGAARLAEAPDMNPDPHIVEINLEARLATVEIAPGQRVDAWTYNGGIPGPLIRVHVGDRLIVHFSNALPQPTTVHWHGLRIPIQMDGVPGVSQPEVKPGTTFTYDFTVPDAGLYWYHPHVMSAAQVGFGLYGALLVEDPREEASGLDETVLVLSDIEFDDHGKLEDPDTGGSTGMAFGREGNHVLVNGREQPTLVARPGVPQRWRIVNAAKSRYFEIDPLGLKFRTVGGDGGLQEAPVTSETIVIAPGERIDTIVTAEPKVANPLTVDYRLFNRGYGSVEARIPIVPLFTLKFEGEPASAPATIPDLRRTIAPLSTAGAREVKVELTIAQRENGVFEYGVNGVPFQKDHAFTAQPGETQIWTLVNSTAWSHPFHIHGFFFQVLDEHGQPVRPLAWKDTVNVPFKSTVRIAVRFDEGRPGAWMFHCHILDHADGGLMGTVLVGVPATSSETMPAHTH